MNVYLSLGCLPRADHLSLLEMIHLTEFSEPLLGTISKDKLQICPQNRGQVTSELLTTIQEKYPTTQFRLHANVQVLDRALIIDLSQYATRPDYFNALVDVHRFIKAPVYTAHAGRREHCSLQKAFENTLDLEQKLGIPVGIEGHYPAINNMFLMSDWKEYSTLLESNVNYVIDLSHLNIVARRYGKRVELVNELVNNPRCIEVHISHNDGLSDKHLQLDSKPWWWNCLEYLNPTADVFTEGSQKESLPHV